MKARRLLIGGGVTLMLLTAAMMATAYHIPKGTQGEEARAWINPEPGLVVQCESLGPGDPINELPAPVGGVGGLCFASSQHLATDQDKKDKKETAQDTWGAVEPKCETSVTPEGCEPGGGAAGEEDKAVLGNWFARVGSNTRSCQGEWGQTFVYKEMTAYYGGTAPNDKGVSGHITFFVTTPGTTGTYNWNKFAEDPIDTAKSADGGCTGNDVGLCDSSLKDASPCDGALKVE